MAHAGGRPTDYTCELGALFCDALAAWDGSVDSLCRQTDCFPNASTIYSWRNSNEQFSKMFWIAKRLQADTFAEAIICHTEEMLDVARESEYDEAIDDQGRTITNTEVLGRSKLRIDALEKVIKAKNWMMARLEPKRWGDKQQIELDNKNVSDDEKEKIKETLKGMDKENEKAY